MSRSEPAGTWSEDQLLADVESGPQGADVGAFFDFDGTLIDGYSLGAFARHHVRSLHVTPADLGRMLLIGLRLTHRGGVTTEEDFERFFVLGMRSWTGRSEDELTELGERLWVQAVAGSLYPEAWRLVAAHRRAGHTVVLASSATRFQVEPAARAMGVDHVLVTPVGFADGVCTGRSGGPPLWRAGKAAAVRAFAAAHGLDLAAGYAYSNGDEDVPFLCTAGHPRALNPGPGLAAEASRRGWPVARFAPRGRPGWGDLARTAAGVGGMLTGFGAGLLLGSLNGTRRDGVDLGTLLAGELGAALAGVRLEVRGGEHLESARPAVFLFNHQSQLDVLILAKLLRGGFTGVAKKEAADTPGFGWVFRLADVAFVDRADSGQARAALEPAVARLRAGISLVIAPEGTRSVTPALGPFKKGAFHVAMQAGVPVVPIVVHNAGELMWRGASAVRPGSVRVTVLAPVPTAGWRSDQIGARAEEIRGRYLDTLAARPAGGVHTVEVGAGSGTSEIPEPEVPDREMTPLETATWRAEAADPSRAATLTVLELLASEPDRGRLLAAHEWASRMVPRMRRSVVEPALGVGTPALVVVPDIDLGDHIGHLVLPAPGSARQLLDAVAEFAATPLRRDRPLWEVLLITGLRDGGAGYAVKTHRSATDGAGAVAQIARLHSRRADPDPDRPEPAPPAPGDTSPVDLLAARIGRAATAAPTAVLRGGVGLLWGPREVLARTVDGARVLARTLAPPAAGSPLLAARGGRWRLDTLDVALDELRAGAGACGGSVDDGLLAAVLGGFARYHRHLGAHVTTLAIGLPVGLRTEQDPRGRLTGARFDAPLDIPDVTERIRAVREFVVTGDTGTDAAAVLEPALPWLPAPVLGALGGRLSTPVDVQVATLPGVGHPVFLAGARVTASYPFGPLSGCAVTVTLVAHEATGCIGLGTDPSAVTEPELLVECLTEGLAEVTALDS